MSVSLTDLVLDAQRFADMVGVEFVDAGTWQSWATQGQEELFQVVSSCYADTFYTSTEFSLDGSSNAYTLPDNFRRIKGLDLNPTTCPRTVRKFNFGDRNNYGRGGIGRGLFCRDRAYRVVSRTTMIIEPPESCAGDYRLYWVMGPTAFANPSSTLMPELEPWAEYVALVMARKALLKEESDTSGVDERIAQMRLDIQTAVETDEGEADTIVDVEGRGGFWR